MSSESGKVERWGLVADAGEFESVRVDARFTGMLRLARAVNAIRFFESLMVAADQATTPALRRQRWNAFLGLAAAVYDALAVAWEAEKQLGELPSFQRVLAPLVRDSETDGFVEQVLRPLRERAAAYTAEPAIHAVVSGLRRPEQLFADGLGPGGAALHYTLADEVAVRAALGLDGSVDLEAELPRYIRPTADLADLFCRAADEVMAELLRSQPWRLKEASTEG